LVLSGLNNVEVLLLLVHAIGGTQLSLDFLELHHLHVELELELLHSLCLVPKDVSLGQFSVLGPR